VHFVDEQDVARAQVGEDGGQVAGALDGWPGGNFDVHPHLVRQHVRECGLAEAGRTVKQAVVERLTAHLGRRDEDGQVLFHLVLPDQFVEFLRAEGVINLIIWAAFGGYDAIGGVGHGGDYTRSGPQEPLIRAGINVDGCRSFRKCCPVPHQPLNTIAHRKPGA